MQQAAEGPLICNRLKHTWSAWIVMNSSTALYIEWSRQRSWEWQLFMKLRIHVWILFWWSALSQCRTKMLRKINCTCALMHMLCIHLSTYDMHVLYAYIYRSWSIYQGVLTGHHWLWCTSTLLWHVARSWCCAYVVYNLPWCWAMSVKKTKTRRALVL